MKYRTIVADPPWPFNWGGSPGGTRRNQTYLGYETMSINEIVMLCRDTQPWHPNATLYMWATQEAIHTGDARRVAVNWGFPDRVGEFIWRKPNFGVGKFPRIGHETCLIYKRGTGSLRPDVALNVHSVQTWSQPHTSHGGGKTHSAKPDGFYDEIERANEGPFLEMFSRRARLGDWHYWGDQSLETAQIGEAA